MRPDKSAPLAQELRAERFAHTSAVSYRIVRIKDGALVGTVQRSAHGWRYNPHNARQQPSRKYHAEMEGVLRAHFNAADRRRIMEAVNAVEVNRMIAVSEARDYPPHEKKEP